MTLAHLEDAQTCFEYFLPPLLIEFNSTSYQGDLRGFITLILDLSPSLSIFELFLLPSNFQAATLICLHLL